MAFPWTCTFPMNKNETEMSDNVQIMSFYRYSNRNSLVFVVYMHPAILQGQHHPMSTFIGIAIGQGLV